MKLRSMLILSVAFVMVACLAPRASAQVGGSAAQLNGSVKDESGGSVAKTSITLREADTNRTYTAVSNDSGFYVFPNLPSGRY